MGFSAVRPQPPKKERNSRNSHNYCQTGTQYLLNYGQKSTKISQKCLFCRVEDKAKGKELFYIFKEKRLFCAFRVQNRGYGSRKVVG